MNTEHRERIKREFLEHIGRVITRNRENHGMLQEALGKEVGVSGSAISRYEYGEGNITASMMAYISVELGFPLREYIEDYAITSSGERKSVYIDEILRELVIASEKKTTMKKMGVTQDITGTELNTDNNQYEFSFSTNEKEQEFSANNIHPDNAAMLREYMMHDTSGATELIRFIYSIVKRQSNAGISQALKDLIGAVLSYAGELLSEEVRPYYKSYISEIASKHKNG